MHWQEAVKKSNNQRAYRWVKDNNYYPSDTKIIRFLDGRVLCTMYNHFHLCSHTFPSNVEGHLDWEAA